MEARDTLDVSLFAGPALSDLLGNARRRAENRAHGVTAVQLVGDVDALAEQLVAEVSYNPVTIDVGGLFLLREPEPTPTYGGGTGLLWEFRVPFAGSSEVLTGRANTYNIGGGPQARVLGHEIAIDLVLDPKMLSDEVESRVHQQIAEIQRQLAWGNEQVVAERMALLESVRTILRTRAASATGGKAVAQALRIPLLRRESPPSIPLVPTVVPLPTRPEARTASPAEHAQLQEDAYRSVLSTIDSFGRALERLPRTFAGLGEEELRDFLLVILNASYRGVAAGEVFNRGGKTDILLRHDDANLFIGECKIWHGSEAAQTALESQLFNYLAWRDTSAALILFIRKAADPTSLMRKAYDLLANHEQLVDPAPLFVAGERHDFRLQHPEDPQRILRLALLTFYVPDEPDEDAPADAVVE